MGGDWFEALGVGFGNVAWRLRGMLIEEMGRMEGHSVLRHGRKSSLYFYFEEAKSSSA